MSAGYRMLMEILIAGGSGFVGSHLTTELLERKHAVRVMTRHPKTRTDGATDVFGDVADRSSLSQALDGVDAAYYLVHSLDRGDFAAIDREGAIAFGREAASAGLQRVVYLGGLGDENDDLSPHLRSRREVEQILMNEAPTTALRAGIVVGDGSVSWEILCQLIERLPVMITPRWVQTKTQPIALSDVVTYLADSLELDVAGQHFDIGGPQAMTYREMLVKAARQMDRRLLILPVPLLTPTLSSHWLRLITDVDLQTARSLVDSMTNEVVVTERRLEQLTGHHAMPFFEASSRALKDRQARKMRSKRDAVPV